MARIIVADYEIYGKIEPCLVAVGGTEEDLARMINNPTKEDKALIRTGKNLRFEEIPDKDCWWNDPFLAN